MKVTRDGETYTLAGFVETEHSLSAALDNGGPLLVLLHPSRLNEWEAIRPLYERACSASKYHQIGEVP